MKKYESDLRNISDYINSQEDVNFIITENYFSTGIKRGLGIDEPFVWPIEFVSNENSHLAYKKKNLME